MSCNRLQEIYKNLLNMYMVYSKSELFLKVKFWYQLNIQREKMVYGFRHLFLINVPFIRLTIYFRQTFGGSPPNISNFSFWVFQNNASIIGVHKDNRYLVWLNIE